MFQVLDECYVVLLEYVVHLLVNVVHVSSSGDISKMLKRDQDSIVFDKVRSWIDQDLSALFRYHFDYLIQLLE